MKKDSRKTPHGWGTLVMKSAQHWGYFKDGLESGPGVRIDLTLAHDGAIKVFVKEGYFEQGGWLGERKFG